MSSGVVGVSSVITSFSGVGRIRSLGGLGYRLSVIGTRPVGFRAGSLRTGQLHASTDGENKRAKRR